MEVEPLCRRATVQFVSDNRMSDGRKMRADLVAATGFDGDV